MKMKTSHAKDYLKSYEKSPGEEFLKKSWNLWKGCWEAASACSALDALELEPESINVVYGDAQNMGFNDETFDCVPYITSVEFIDDCEKAMKESKRVLKNKGKILLMMLNPESDYFAERYSNENSYIRKNINYRNISEMVKCISSHFSIKSKGYFLGIKNDGFLILQILRRQVFMWSRQ